MQHYMTQRYKGYKYKRRSRYAKSDPVGGLVAVFVILAAIALLSSLGKVALLLAITLCVLGPFVLLIYVLSKVFDSVRTPTTNKEMYVKRIREHSKDAHITVLKNTNSEKHGCKCYMENLNEGEQQVADLLSHELSYQDYFIFNNLTIPSSHIISSQVDHIVVSRFGIFVIETKEWNGWVSGHAEDVNWSEKFARGKSPEFQNPLKQNWSHIKSLQELLPFIPETSFENVVVFMGRGKLMFNVDKVVRIDELISLLMSFSEEKILESDMQLIIGKLTFACQTVDITHEEHVQNIRMRHSEKHLQPAN
jgi:restriction system protein